MTGIYNLDQILVSLKPVLQDKEYIFCTFENTTLKDVLHLNPLATFGEQEGLTLVLDKETAINNSIPFESSYRLITLSVHSSLEAVGLTAAFAGKLAEKGISANVMAAYYHDHIFVPVDKAEEAMYALLELQTRK